MKKHSILLVGTGPMAVDYYKALNDFNVAVVVIGRGAESSEKFAQNTGFKPLTGGLENFLKTNPDAKIEKAIIATGVEALMPSLKLLLNFGVEEILIEKPAAISISELIENESEIKKHNKKIFVAYNRRFYASVAEAQKIIEEDGGLSSMHFEFTEWGHVIAPLKKAEGVKENWFLANSSHVVDLAFYLAGKPVNWHTFTSGNNGWHSPTSFVGSGITEKNTLFSYQANWEAPGRWAVELLTKKHRLFLKPVEKLFVQKIGTVNLEERLFDNSLDTKYKPGVYNQVKVFLEDGNGLLNIDEHIDNSRLIYSKIVKQN